MVTIDHYASLGYALELLAHSTYHKQYALGPYFEGEIIPPLQRNQMRLYVQGDRTPTAMISWAWLSAEVEKDVLATGRQLAYDEWTCGDRLFFNDWVTPYGNTRDVVHDMTHNVFPDQLATSLRRNPDGTVRRINRWTGVNLRQPDPAKAGAL